MVIYEYQGFRYWQEEDDDGDVVKLWHRVLTPDGQALGFDWSPYATPSEADFRRWVDLGCPGRMGRSPLDTHDLIRGEARS